MPVLALVLSELAGAYFNPSATAMKAGVACLSSIAQDRVFLLHSNNRLLTIVFMNSVGLAYQPVLQIISGIPTQMHVNIYQRW